MNGDQHAGSRTSEPASLYPVEAVKTTRTAGGGAIVRPHMIAETDVTKWATWMKAAGRPSTTIDLRTYHVRRTFRETEHTPLTVTTEDLVTWLATKTWAPSTRRAYRSSLRAFFLWMQATGRRADNPAELMPSIKMPRTIPRPTPEQIFRTAVELAEPDVKLMLLLAGYCGLRRSEIARVRREDVHHDLVGPYLRVVGKGGHERPVPLPEELAAELLGRRPGWTFPSRYVAHSGRHTTPAHIGKLVSEALPEGWTCHTLRHRFATVARAHGHDLRVVQELLGHAKLDTTAVYTLVPLSDLRAAVHSTAA